MFQDMGWRTHFLHMATNYRLKDANTPKPICPAQLHGFAYCRFSIWTKGLTSGTGYHRVSKEGIILINDKYLTIFFILFLYFSPLVKSFNVNLIWRTTWLSKRHVHILLLNRNVSKVHGCPRLVLWVNNWPVSNLAIFTNIFISNYRQK